MDPQLQTGVIVAAVGVLICICVTLIAVAYCPRRTRSYNTEEDESTYEPQTTSELVVVAKCPCGSVKINVMECEDCHQVTQGCSECYRRLAPCKCDDAALRLNQRQQPADLSCKTCHQPRDSCGCAQNQWNREEAPCVSCNQPRSSCCCVNGKQTRYPNLRSYNGPMKNEFLSMLNGNSPVQLGLLPEQINRMAPMNAEPPNPYPSPPPFHRQGPPDDRFHSLTKQLATVRKQNAQLSSALRDMATNSRDMEIKLKQKRKQKLLQKLDTIPEQPIKDSDQKQSSDHVNQSDSEQKDCGKQKEPRDEYIEYLQKQMAISMQLNADLMDNFKRNNEHRDLHEMPPPGYPLSMFDDPRDGHWEASPGLPPPISWGEYPKRHSPCRPKHRQCGPQRHPQRCQPTECRELDMVSCADIKTEESQWVDRFQQYVLYYYDELGNGEKCQKPCSPRPKSKRCQIRKVCPSPKQRKRSRSCDDSRRKSPRKRRPRCHPDPCSAKSPVKQKMKRKSGSVLQSHDCECGEKVRQQRSESCETKEISPFTEELSEFCTEVLESCDQEPYRFPSEKYDNKDRNSRKPKWTTPYRDNWRSQWKSWKHRN